MKKDNMKKISGKKIAAAGAGMVALGVASAGAYYMFGPKAKAHQKKATALLAKMKKDVADEIKKAKDAGTPVYHKAVDAISGNYARQYKEHEKEIKAFAKMLKGEWKEVSKKVTKKPAKVVTKKIVK
jgi:F0F1-type ATP synthase membrane subunit b/b'